VVLQAGGNPFGTGSVAATLFQTGIVPQGTKSISFLANASGPFAVTLGGTNLDLVSFPVTNENYSLYEADVSAFAGTTSTLMFSALALSSSASDQGTLFFDDILFSPDAIPEPSGLNLLLIGVLGLGVWHRIRRRAA
jgi:hypothetical protein